MDSTQGKVHPIFQPILDSLMYAPHRVYSENTERNDTQGDNNTERKIEKWKTIN